MLPSPAKQQELLLQWLDGMPPVEHERFLGNWLYLLIQVHITPVRAPGPPALHRDPPLLVLQAVDPAARVGKLTGMLLEQDVDQIVPLFFFPEMVRDLAARSSPTVACTLAHPPGSACGAAATG